MPSQRSQPRQSAFWTVLSTALALSACLTDGPNHVGGKYLDGHGLKLETPLYRVDLTGFAVDSFWTGDVEPARLGDTVILLGAANGFVAQARLGFDIADTSFIDSLKADTSVVPASKADSLLRLSVGFPLHPIGLAQLKATLKPDTLQVLVESWTVRDGGLGKNERLDTLTVHNRRFLVRQDTASILPGMPILDTVRIRLDSAYGRDSLQALPLRNLRKALLANESSKWTVYQQLTYIPDDTTSPGAMLRLGGNIGVRYSPCFLFGRPLNASSATTKQRIAPLNIASPRAFGVNSRLRFHGSANSLLVGKTRGLHLRIERERFLDSIGAALGRQGVSMRRATGGEFDLSWFVPFAKVTLPIDTPTRVDGNFPLEMQMSTDLDSLLPAPDPKAAARVLVSLGGRATLAKVFERNNATKHLDSLVGEYSAAPGDPGLRRFIIKSTRDTSVKDTTYLVPGQSRDVVWGLNGLGANERIVFSTRADSGMAVVDVHVNTRNVGERQTFRDPTTGEALVTLSERLPNFLKPKDVSVALRATSGFQRIFNRVRMDKEIASDLFIQPAPAAAVDTTLKLRVPYPVLGEIKPRLDGGVLKVDITVYLYPLKDR